MSNTAELIARLRKPDSLLDDPDLNDEAADALTAQAAEIEALRADAERYRWLRKGGGLWGICVWDDDEWVGDARTNVDALIDAAIGAGKAVTP